MALCMEAFTDTLPIVYNGFKGSISHSFSVMFVTVIKKFESISCKKKGMVPCSLGLGQARSKVFKSGAAI